VVNISTRLRVQTDENVLIGGFIVTGDAPKVVLIRAIGPSLAQFGITDPLPDPTLELRDSAKKFGGDDNWRDDPVQEAAILATGIPPTNDLESAIVAALDPGQYTATVRGTNNTTGIGLVEVYDLRTGSLDDSGNAKLGNISTRGFVETGDKVMIGGFIIGPPPTSRGVVIRAIGPSLARFGIKDPLADPTLELRDGNGALLVANNDWQDDPTQAAELTAAGLAPTDPLESALITTLPSGNYTAVVAGPNHTTGVALVEVYALQ
jgi:hypothetical protein